MQFLQVSLLVTSQKRSYGKNGTPCWILAYSRERPCRACPTQNSTYCTLTNTFCFTKFEYVMNKLWHFYPKHLFYTSFRTSHKPYFPWSVSPNLKRPTRCNFYKNIFGYVFSMEYKSHGLNHYRKKVIAKMVRWPVNNIP